MACKILPYRIPKIIRDKDLAIDPGQAAASVLGFQIWHQDALLGFPECNGLKVQLGAGGVLGPQDVGSTHDLGFGDGVEWMASNLLEALAHRLPGVTGGGGRHGGVEINDAA